MLLLRPTVDRARLHHARAALAHSVSATAWRDALEMRRPDPTVAVALRVGLATTIALVGGGLLGYTHVAGFAALGALSSAFLRYEPYPSRAVRLPWVGAGITAYTALGAALGALGVPMELQILVISLGAGLAFWLFTAFRLVGPGPVILVFAAAGASGFAADWADVRLVTTAAALGAVAGWVVAMAPALYNPYSPARIAVARALAAVSSLETQGAQAVPAARQSIVRAREVVGACARRDDDHIRELLALLDAAETVVDEGSHETVAERCDDFLRFEAELRKARRDIDIPHVDARGTRVPSAVRGSVGEGFERLTEQAVLAGTGRIVLASLFAAQLAVLCGLGHPLWASMGAMAALQGLNYRNTVQRAHQRMMGNVGGAVVAAVLLALDLGYWPLVVAAVVFQTMAELFVLRNYGLTSVCVTAMALLLTGLGGDAGTELAVDRVGDTLIGVAVGVIVAAVTIRRDDRHHLVA